MNQSTLRLPRVPSPLMRAQIPDVPKLEVTFGGSPALAGIGSNLAPVWHAVQIAEQGKRNEADGLLREMTASSDPAIAWAATLELGALLALGVQTRGESQLTSEGLGYLLEAMSAPYGDIAASAAWNVSEILNMAGRASAADLYGWAARDLGDPRAQIVSARRAFGAENEEAAFEIHSSIVGTTPRWLEERVEAEVALADVALEAASELSRDWFISAQGTLAREDWASIERYEATDAMFNVESGQMAISSQYFPACSLDCFAIHPRAACPECGRAPGAFFSCIAGFGDGVYSVLRLRGANETLGAITVLKDLPAALKEASLQTPAGSARLSARGTGEFLGALLAATAPLVVGEIEVTDRVLFSDAKRGIDGRDVALDIPLESGVYSVVAWMSIPLDDFDTVMRPLAFGVIRGTVANAIRLKTPVLSGATVEAILAETMGDPTIRLANQEKDVVPPLLKRNAESSHDPNQQLSYLLQLAEIEANEEVFYSIYGSPAPSLDEAKFLLSLRGFENFRLPWLNWIPTALVKPPVVPAVAPRVSPPTDAPAPNPPMVHIPSVVESMPEPAVVVSAPEPYVVSAPEPAVTAPEVAPVPTQAMPVTAGPKFCTSCGSKRLGESKFCTSCGAKLG